MKAVRGRRQLRCPPRTTTSKDSKGRSDGEIEGKRPPCACRSNLARAQQGGTVTVRPYVTDVRVIRAIADLRVRFIQVARTRTGHMYFRLLEP